jgi:phosphoribosylamine-glycine ligase
VVPEGYPDNPHKGDDLQLPEELPANVTIFLSAVDVQHGKLVATGSRTVAVVGIGDSLGEAEAVCEEVVREIPGPFFHRTDIGTSSVIARRVDHMKRLRFA